MRILIIYPTDYTIVNEDFILTSIFEMLLPCFLTDFFFKDRFRKIKGRRFLGILVDLLKKCLFKMEISVVIRKCKEWPVAKLNLTSLMF